MTISTMREIDRFVGIPLCWLSGLARKLRRRNSLNSVNSILVIKFFGLGSVLLATPALHRLRVQFPSARITFLTFSSNSELLDEIHLVDERWFIDPRSVAAFCRTFALVLRRILRSSIDVVIDLEFFSKFSTFVGAIAAPSKQIGFALPTRWRSWNLTDPVQLATDQHVSQTFIHCLRPLGIGGTCFSPPQIRIKATPSALPFRVRIEPGRQIICINPNAGRTSLDRRWSGSRFARTIDILGAEHQDLLFCLIGSADEREYVDTVVEQLSRSRDSALNLAGALSLKQLFTLFDQSALLITNDSGPMHIAAAIGLPTVALFGPESPRFYSPLGNRTINLSADVACSPCLSSYNAKAFNCPIHAKCMKEIAVDQVVHAANSLLGEGVAKKYSEKIAS